MPKVLRVALDTPLRQLFDYLPPPPGAGAVTPATGARVRVPFGPRRLVGVIVGEADATDVPPERLKPVLEVLDARPVLDPSLLELLEWAAQYYHHPLGEVLSSALPKALRLGAPALAAAPRWVSTGEGARALAASMRFSG